MCIRSWPFSALIAAFQSDFAYMMGFPINPFLRKRYLAFKKGNRYLKHKTKKGVVTLIRNQVVTLARNTLVTLNRNQVVSLSGISSLKIESKSRHPFAPSTNYNLPPEHSPLSIVNTLSLSTPQIVTSAQRKVPKCYRYLYCQ
jgi:hypothetical protein